MSLLSPLTEKYISPAAVGVRRHGVGTVCCDPVMRMLALLPIALFAWDNEASG